MTKLTLAKQLETAKEAHTAEYNKRLLAERELHLAKQLILDEQKDNRKLRDQLMSKTMENTRLQAILEERDRAERKAAQAAKPQVMVPLEEHPAYRERHMHVDTGFTEMFGRADEERREWYHRS